MTKIKTQENAMLEEHLLGNSWTIMKGLTCWKLNRPWLFQDKLTGLVREQMYGTNETYTLDPDPRADDENMTNRALWETSLHRIFKGQAITRKKAERARDDQLRRWMRGKARPPSPTPTLADWARTKSFLLDTELATVKARLEKEAREAVPVDTGRMKEDLTTPTGKLSFPGAWIDEADELPDFEFPVSPDWIDPRLEVALDWASADTVPPPPVEQPKPYSPWTVSLASHVTMQDKPVKTEYGTLPRDEVALWPPTPQPMPAWRCKLPDLKPINQVGGKFYEQSPGKSYTVCGDVTVYFENPALYSAMIKGQEELQAKIRKLVNEYLNR